MIEQIINKDAGFEYDDEKSERNIITLLVDLWPGLLRRGPGPGQIKFVVH
jgi:hypothetical protein